MEIGRTVQAIVLAGAVGLTAGGCSAVHKVERPAAMPGSIALTDCEKWAVADQAEKAQLANDLTAVADLYTIDVKNNTNRHPITPGLGFVAGCGKLVLSSKGVGYVMYPGQANKVINSVTHKVVPQAEVSAVETEYDVASVTKLVTTVGILMMQQDGLININDPVGKFVPEYSQGNKAGVSFKMLLSHESGLVDPPYIRVVNGSHDPNKIWRNLLGVPLTNPPGTPYSTEENYSNIGFNVAYIAATNAANISPASYLLQKLFAPMGLHHSNYAPEAQNCAPTSPDANQGVTLDCVPQDDMARSLNMRAGNASLFMSTSDLGEFLSMLSDGGTYEGHRYLTPESMSMLETPSNPAKSYGLGDRMNGSGLYGKDFAPNAYGHTGWNGGAAVVNPENGLFLAELMNGTDSQVAPTDVSYKMIRAMIAALVQDTAALK